MPRRFHRKRKTKFVTRRALPFLLNKHAEPRYIDDPNGGSNIPINDILPHDSELTLISTGGNVNSREGNEIRVSGFYLSLTCRPDITGVTATNNVRYLRVVLYTKRSLAEVDMDVTPTEIIQRENYIVWADKMCQVPLNSPGSNSMIKIRKKWKPYMKVIYDGSGESTATSNALFLHVSTDSPDPELVEFSYNARLYFREL